MARLSGLLLKGRERPFSGVLFSVAMTRMHYSDFVAAGSLLTGHIESVSSVGSTATPRIGRGGRSSGPPRRCRPVSTAPRPLAALSPALSVITLLPYLRTDIDFRHVSSRLRRRLTIAPGSDIAPDQIGRGSTQRPCAGAVHLRILAVWRLHSSGRCKYRCRPPTRSSELGHVGSQRKGVCQWPRSGADAVPDRGSAPWPGGRRVITPLSPSGWIVDRRGFRIGPRLWLRAGGAAEFTSGLGARGGCEGDCGVITRLRHNLKETLTLRCWILPLALVRCLV
ncbi:hypothetical protein GZL_p00074 (plasmid) [Streptomyces sp. 769]|nr:hypothetical protein GZL_p00074 [Streptomyces sp. 769]